MTRYVRTRVFYTIALGSATPAVAFFISVLIFGQRLRLVLPAVYPLLLVVLVTSSRITLRSALSGHNERPITSVTIHGTGQLGGQLLEATKQVNECSAVTFVDDSPVIQHPATYDVVVYRPSGITDLISRRGVEKTLLAIPSTTMEERKAIVENLKQYSCEVLTIPGMKGLVDEKIKVSSLKKISVVDPPGHDPVTPHSELTGADIISKVVMVMDAGGSIGSRLCRQILKCRPARSLLFELPEFSLHSIDEELHERLTGGDSSIGVLPFLDSIQNKERLPPVVKAFTAGTIYHVTAYKYAPTVEFNTVEGIRNNVFGTLLCMQVAVGAGVGTLVLISTDKAVRPTNIMDVSKRMVELHLQALTAEPGQQTRFCMVRFGSVFSSSGSAVPVFEKQVTAGNPITLTHQDITRYFMTIPEATQLTIQADAMGRDGDVFILNMGESVKIIGLAKQMINLSGLQLKDENHPDDDIETKTTGLCPGEKLYKELLIGNEVQKITYPRIMIASEIMLPWGKSHDILSRMESTCRKMNQTELRILLLEAPIGFNPEDEICDLVRQQNEKVV